MKHDPADAYHCSYCGIKEDIHLLDGVLVDEQDSGDLACIKCYPGDNWCCGSLKMLSLSIAPSLKPYYDQYESSETFNERRRRLNERRPSR